MLKVTAWPDVRDAAKWYKLPQSRKSMHAPGSHSEIKRVYHYEPVVFSDGTINVPLRFWGGESFVLVEKQNFVAIWGYEQQVSRWSRSGYSLATWFRYYFEPEPEQPELAATPLAELEVNPEAAPAARPDQKQKRGRGQAKQVALQIRRLGWNQLGSRIQHEVTQKWREVASDWMLEPERVSRYRQGLIVSGKTDRTASITAADIVANDPAAIELDEVTLLASPISDKDILL